MNIPIFAPANYAELRYWLTVSCARGHTARAMIRYARGGENPALAALPCTGSALRCARHPVDGARVALVSYGAETEEIIAAKDLLAQHGVQADCVQADRSFTRCRTVLCDSTDSTTTRFCLPRMRCAPAASASSWALPCSNAGWQGKYLLHAVDNSHLLHASVPELRKDQQPGCRGPLAQTSLTLYKVRRNQA